MKYIDTRKWVTGKVQFSSIVYREAGHTPTHDGQCLYGEDGGNDAWQRRIDGGNSSGSDRSTVLSLHNTRGQERGVITH